MKTVEMPKEVKEYFATGPRTIEKVIPNEDYSLTIHFDNGEIRAYNMNDMLFGVFEVLKDRAKFKKVFLDEYVASSGEKIAPPRKGTGFRPTFVETC